MESCLYEGWIRHRRFAPRPHSFRYSAFLAYLDLSELAEAFSVHPWWRAERPGYASFRRADHFGPADQPLSDCVRELVHERLGFTPTGPIRLLTQLRFLGYVFNPVSFFYCFDPTEQVTALVAEVHNTPWGERHCYVLPAAAFSGRNGEAWRTPKVFHVSPFMPMDLCYRWRMPSPHRRLTAHLANLRSDQVVFDVTMQLRRRPWTRATLRRSMLRHPWMTGKVTAAIYWQAFRLWWKKIPFHPHPRHRLPDESHTVSASSEAPSSQPASPQPLLTGSHSREFLS